MSTFQTITIVGFLGNDPENLQFENGGEITKFSVATTETWNDKSTGEKKEKTEWHNIVTRGKSAEICNKYLNKGSYVLIVGKLETRKWQDKDGNDRWTTQIIADRVKFLSSNKSNSQNTGSAVDQYQNNKQESHGGDDFLNGNYKAKKGGDDDDDLPF